MNHDDDDDDDDDDDVIIIIRRRKESGPLISPSGFVNHISATKEIVGVSTKRLSPPPSPYPRRGAATAAPRNASPANTTTNSKRGIDM